MQKLIGIALLSILLSGCFDEQGTGLPVVGIDKDGNEIFETISKKSFESDVEDILEVMTDETNQVMFDREYLSDYEIESIIVGMGITTNFKIKHLTSLTSSGRFRMAFSKSSSPVIPE